MDELSIIQDRFTALFRANNDSKVIRKIDGSIRIKGEAPTADDFTNHLKGEYGIGVLPIQYGGTCWFACMDYDKEKTLAERMDIESLYAKIKDLELPLVPCWSKSGGVHLYLFGTEPLNVGTVRLVQEKWKNMLRGFGETEIELFPKQLKLEKGAKGSPISIPYFNYQKGRQYCQIGDRILNIIEFMDFADANKVSNAELIRLAADEDREAPPCIQKMLKMVMGEGSRNQTTYHYGVYAKKAYGDQWKSKIEDFNALRFKRPMEHKEVEDLQASLSRKEYRYKCSDEPMRSLCDSATCLKRQFGITKDEEGYLSISGLPNFTQLKKHMTDPVTWELYIEDQPICLTTEDIMSFKAIQKAILETLNKVVMQVKAHVWAKTLSGLMVNVEIITPPRDATREGVILEVFHEYISKAAKYFDSDGLDPAGWEGLKKKWCPVVKQDKGVAHVFFKGTDWVDFISSRNIKNVTQELPWRALRSLKPVTTTITIGKRTTVFVWGVPMTEELKARAQIYCTSIYSHEDIVELQKTFELPSEF